MRQKRVRRNAIAGHVKLVRDNAVYILQIDDKGNVQEKINPNSRLDVIAVIGPHRNEKYNLDEALLLEVGLNHTRPYKEVHVPPKKRRPNDPKYFHPRYGGFAITPEQYHSVAPYIFKFLLDLSIKKVSNRRDGWAAYTVKSLGAKNSGERLSKPYLSKGRARLIAVEIKYDKFPKVRYTASLTDELLVYDLYWAELVGNTALCGQMKRMATDIEGLLDKALKRTRYTPKDWSRNRYFTAAWETFHRFTQSVDDKLRDRSYLQKILLREHIGSQNYFFEVIREKMKWSIDDLDLTIEELYANEALPDAEERLGGIQLSIWRQFSGLVSFDIYPPKPEMGQDHIPF